MQNISVCLFFFLPCNYISSSSKHCVKKMHGKDVGEKLSNCLKKSIKLYLFLYFFWTSSIWGWVRLLSIYILPCHENNYLCNNDAEQIKSFIEPSNATAIYLLRKEKNVWQLMFIYKYVAKCNTAVQQISIFGYKFFLVFHTRMNIWPVFQFPLFISLAS